MSFITASLARQSAIARANQAEMDAIRASQAQQSLIGKSGNLADISRKETQLQIKKEQAELKAKVAKAEAEALKKKKSKRNKLDIYA